MDTVIAWVLNLDAEDELAHPGAHTPSAASIERIQRHVGSLTLVGADDLVVWPSAGVQSARGVEGRAWCPTRWARDLLEEAGAVLPVCPSMDVLRAVNHRAFSARLGQFLPGAAFITSAKDLDAYFSASRTRVLLLKRPFGYAGRGRRKISGVLTNADLAWLDASFGENGGLQVEPYVKRMIDCALHGEVSQSGEVHLGQPTIQDVDALGTWRSTRLALPGELEAREFEALEHEARRTANALHEAGYFGPFGIDGFRWTDGFQPRSEINARYSMGWAIGCAQRPR